MLEENRFQQGIEAGIFRAVEPKEAALVFMTMIQGNFPCTICSAGGWRVRKWLLRAC